MSRRGLVIAIDGPAASGKSTTARIVAERLGYIHVDTGAMYRAVTLKVLRSGLSLSDEHPIAELVAGTSVSFRGTGTGTRFLLDGEDVTEQIRSASVTRAVSTVSSLAPVREVMVREQRRLGAEGGVVVDGRDIGTVVFPNADLKIFLLAGIEARAHRRHKELSGRGGEADLVTLRREIEDRDRFDSTRPASPLRKAEDAIAIDTSHLTIDQQVNVVLEKVHERIEEKKTA